MGLVSMWFDGSGRSRASAWIPSSSGILEAPNSGTFSPSRTAIIHVLDRANASVRRGQGEELPANAAVARVTWPPPRATSWRLDRRRASLPANHSTAHMGVG
jgi:hypothetical protein